VISAGGLSSCFGRFMMLGKGSESHKTAGAPEGSLLVGHISVQQITWVGCGALVPEPTDSTADCSALALRADKRSLASSGKTGVHVCAVRWVRQTSPRLTCRISSNGPQTRLTPACQWQVTASASFSFPPAHWLLRSSSLDAPLTGVVKSACKEKRGRGGSRHECDMVSGSSTGPLTALCVRHARTPSGVKTR
jgi:hypothetical protein